MNSMLTRQLKSDDNLQHRPDFHTALFLQVSRKNGEIRHSLAVEYFLIPQRVDRWGDHLGNRPIDAIDKMAEYRG